MHAIDLLFVASIFAPVLAVVVGILMLAAPAKRAKRQSESAATVAAH